jgi:parvulin-like peptidyl-prolyl isomerase
MEGYINKVVGSEVAKKTEADWKKAYLANEQYSDANDVVDYSKFIYYEGKVALGNTNPADYFNAKKGEIANDSYLALSAVNELMFAYSTDPGCLNSYMGYAVSPYKTDFVPEFEYAAQYAVAQGVGTYVVAPSDYGWHIIYVTFVYDAGEVYGGVNVEDIKNENEGTFSYLFYESLKSTTATNYTTEVENTVIKVYKGAGVRNMEAYEDLLELDKNV